MTLPEMFFAALTEAIVVGILPYAIIAALIAILHSVGAFGIRSARVALGFSSFGLFLGFFIGASRDPVVSALLPGAVTLIGGYLAFVFNKSDGLRATAFELAPFAVTFLTISATFGAVLASDLRTEGFKSEMVTEFNDWQNRGNEEFVNRPLDGFQSCMKIVEDTKICASHFLPAR